MIILYQFSLSMDDRIPTLRAFGAALVLYSSSPSSAGTELVIIRLTHDGHFVGGSLFVWYQYQY
jgi:hypothetical protein